MRMLTTGLPYKLMSSVYSGKTALVTGANSPSGVGYALSQQLLRNGVARLIIGVRTKAKGEAARKSLLADPEVKGSPEILIYEVEMLSHDSVLAFSRAILADIPKLDIALLNAGIQIFSWSTSSYTNNETVFQVNHLSTALLAIYLLPLLRASSSPSSPSHLTIVSSVMQTFSHFRSDPIPTSQSVFEYMNSPQTYHAWFRYNDTKLLIGAFIRKLARHVSSDEVIINDACPGYTNTDFDKTLSWFLKPFAVLVRKLTAKSPEDGAKGVLVAVQGGKEVHGKFVSSGSIQPELPILGTDEGKEIEAKVWKETLEAAEKVLPRSTTDISK